MQGLFAAPTSREVLRGAVKQIVYTNAENAYTVMRLEVDEGPSPVTVVGNFVDVQLGEELQLHGQWSDHAQYGRQFQTTHFARNQPSTLKGIRRYLSSMVDGIGPALAKRLVSYFKLETLRIIDQEPERLTEVKGIAKARVGQIRTAWERHRGVQEVMVFLQGYQVTPHQAMQIFRQYGNDALRLIRENPYRLATDIRGFGFHTADEIAIKLGVERDSPARAQAALMYFLEQSSRQGHMYYPKSVLVQEMAPQFGIQPDRVEEAIATLDGKGDIVIEALDDDLALFIRVLAACERGSARRVRNMIGHQQPLPRKELDASVNVFEREVGIQLAPTQREAVYMAASSPFSIITGGPGTGKTTIVRAVCHWGTQQQWRIMLAAPTGRAAKRLNEASGLPASTLHRLLEFAPHDGKFQRNDSRPLELDLLIIDEASMIDIYLFYAVVRAVPPGARLLLVGDADQLPSVGPGNVLLDLIQSRVAPVTRLDQIFRQQEGGLIIENAHRINQGKLPLLPNPPPNQLLDFYFIPAKAKQPPKGQRYTEAQAQAIWSAETIVEMVTKRMPRRFGLNPREDIQVISPMHRGDVGVQALNQRLQAALSLGKPALQAGSLSFQIGDRVLQTRNDYDKEVFNGDIGRVDGIDREQGQLSVDFEGRTVVYERNTLDDLTLAYAISVHKSQGSEYPAVIIPILSQHHIMLQRNLLYTALTRGKKLVVVVGTKHALKYAVQNDEIRRRFSRLAWRLEEGKMISQAALLLASDERQ